MVSESVALIQHCAPNDYRRFQADSPLQASTLQWFSPYSLALGPSVRRVLGTGVQDCVPARWVIAQWAVIANRPAVPIRSECACADTPEIECLLRCR